MLKFRCPTTVTNYICVWQWPDALFYALNQLHTVVQAAFQLWLNPGPLFVWWTWREEMTASIESSLTGTEYNYTASCWWTHTNSLMGPSRSTDLRPPSTRSFVSVITKMSSSDICSYRIKSSTWTWHRQLSALLFTSKHWQALAFKVFCHPMKHKKENHSTKWRQMKSHYYAHVLKKL